MKITTDSHVNEPVTQPAAARSAPADTPSPADSPSSSVPRGNPRLNALRDLAGPGSQHARPAAGLGPRAPIDALNRHRSAAALRTGAAPNTSALGGPGHSIPIAPAMAQQIEGALKDAARGKHSTVLVVGISPNAPVDAARSIFNLVQTGAQRGKLAPGSAVVLHVPAKWMTHSAELMQRLMERGVRVIVAPVNEAVYGDIGGSAEPGTHRPPARAHAADITGCTIHTGREPLEDAPLIRPKALMQSLNALLAPDAMREKVSVLTDKDEYLPQIARQAGVVRGASIGRPAKARATETDARSGTADASHDLSLDAVFRPNL